MTEAFSVPGSKPEDEGDDLWDFSVGRSDEARDVESDLEIDIVSPDVDLESEVQSAPPLPLQEKVLQVANPAGGYLAPQTACSVRRFEQLFVRGANVVLVRVLPSTPATSTTEETVE